MKINKTAFQDQIIEQLGIDTHGLLLLAPRVGKTRIAIELIKKEKPKTILWVTPNVRLRDVDIPNEFSIWSAKRYLNKTTIICYGSLADMSGHFDRIILDEYQDITIANSEPFFNGQITYGKIIGLSGTHPSHKEKLDIYKRLHLKVLKEIRIEQAQEAGLISDYKITVKTINLNSTDKNIEAGAVGKKFMTTERANYDYLSKTVSRAMFSNNPAMLQFAILRRLRFIYTLQSKYNAAKEFIKTLKGRTLIFSGGIEVSEFLTPYTYNSKTDDYFLKKFLAGEINVLSCVNSGGVGFTYRNVDNFVIVQVNSNKKGDVTQKIARSLLEQKGYKANIYIFVAKDTVDQDWLEKALVHFSPDKITRE